jgi:hypothetical protein
MVTTAPEVREEIRGRPHERTMERHAFTVWIQQLDHSELLTPITKTWFQHRFLNELDRRRGLERRWRKIFWVTRYTALSGSLTLPVLITAGKSIAWLNITGIAVSIVVAMATAMEALLRSGRKWRLYRQGADRMSSEGTAFFQEIGDYAEVDFSKRIQLFKEQIEVNIKELHESYVADIDIAAAQNVIGSSSERPS